MSTIESFFFLALTVNGGRTSTNTSDLVLSEDVMSFDVGFVSCL